MRTIYDWFTVKAVRSWYAHFIVCLLVALALGMLASYLRYNSLLTMCLSSTGTLLFYLVKEMGDELHYRREGTYHKRRWADKVKASTDRGGDTLGPCAVFFTLWSCYAVQAVFIM